MWWTRGGKGSWMDWNSVPPCLRWALNQQSRRFICSCSFLSTSFDRWLFIFWTRSSWAERRVNYFTFLNVSSCNEWNKLTLSTSLLSTSSLSASSPLTTIGFPFCRVLALRSVHFNCPVARRDMPWRRIRRRLQRHSRCHHDVRHHQAVVSPLEGHRVTWHE